MVDNWSSNSDSEDEHQEDDVPDVYVTDCGSNATIFKKQIAKNTIKVRIYVKDIPMMDVQQRMQIHCKRLKDFLKLENGELRFKKLPYGCWLTLFYKKSTRILLYFFIILTVS